MPKSVEQHATGNSRRKPLPGFRDEYVLERMKAYVREQMVGRRPKTFVRDLREQAKLYQHAKTALLVHQYRLAAVILDVWILIRYQGELKEIEADSLLLALQAEHLPPDPFGGYELDGLIRKYASNDIDEFRELRDALEYATRAGVSPDALVEFLFTNGGLSVCAEAWEVNEEVPFPSRQLEETEPKRITEQGEARQIPARMQPRRSSARRPSPKRNRTNQPASV